MFVFSFSFDCLFTQDKTQRCLYQGSTSFLNSASFFVFSSRFKASLGFRSSWLAFKLETILAILMMTTNFAFWRIQCALKTFLKKAIYVVPANAPRTTRLLILQAWVVYQIKTVLIEVSYYAFSLTGINCIVCAKCVIYLQFALTAIEVD